MRANYDLYNIHGNGKSLELVCPSISYFVWMIEYERAIDNSKGKVLSLVTFVLVQNSLNLGHKIFHFPTYSVASERSRARERSKRKDYLNPLGGFRTKLKKHYSPLVPKARSWMHCRCCSHCKICD